MFITISVTIVSVAEMIFLGWGTLNPKQRGKGGRLVCQPGWGLELAALIAAALNLAVLIVTVAVNGPLRWLLAPSATATALMIWAGCFIGFWGLFFIVAKTSQSIFKSKEEFRLAFKSEQLLAERLKAACVKNEILLDELKQLEKEKQELAYTNQELCHELAQYRPPLKLGFEAERPKLVD